MRKNAGVRAGASKPVPLAAPAGDPRPSEWRGHFLPMAGLWLVTLLAYSNSFSPALVFDNAAILLNDPRVTAVTTRNLHLIWTTEYWYSNAGNGLFRPLTTLSYLFNYAILGNGSAPAGYHWVNYLLHAAAATLLYLLGLAIFRRRAPAVALAAVWALHPVLTESITNVVGRADILGGCGVLGALLCHIQAAAAEGRRKWVWLGGVALATAIGIFSKESAAAVVGLAFLYDLAFPGKTPWRARLAGYGAMFLALLAYLAVRPAMPPAHFAFTDNPILGAGFVPAKLTAVKVIGKYLALLAWPAQLSADYSYRAIPLVTEDWSRWENWQAVLALAVCLGGLGLAFLGWRRNRALFFFVTWFFVALAPTANLAVTFGTIMAERLLYLPAIGFAGCLVLAVDGAAARFAKARDGRWPWVATAVLAAICLALGARTWSRNLDWRSERTLWSSAVAAEPDSYKTHQAYASTGLMLDDAIGQIGRSLEIVGEVPDGLSTGIPYINAGQWYREKGESLAKTAPTESAAWYRKSVDVLEHARRIEAATQHVYPELYQQLGRAYLRAGEFREAVVVLEQALRWRLQSDLLENLSQAYYQVGDMRHAEISLLQGLVTSPDNARFVSELIGLYQRGNAGSCAVAAVGGKLALDPNCPLVHEQLCAAAGKVLEIYVAGKQPELADQTRAKITSAYGCPAQ